jgi:hypothetical protein
VAPSRLESGRFSFGYQITAGGPRAPYAVFVHEGTRPHIIRVRSAKVLTDGVRFFGPQVRHPGTRAQPFLTQALQIAGRG